MIMVGFLVGIFIATRRARKAGMDPNYILDLGIYLVVFGVLGARLFFILQFSSKFNLRILNFLDGNFSIIGLVAGVGLGAALYFLRDRIGFLKRFRDSTTNTKTFFTALALLAAIVLGRTFYIVFNPSSLKTVVVVNPSEDFFPDSFRHEPVFRPDRSLDRRIVKIVGRIRVEGESFSEDVVHAYEFKSAVEPKSVHGLTLEEAERWVERREGARPLEIRPPYSLMLFEIWKGGLVYYGGVIGAILAALLFAYRRSISFWRLADICAPSVAIGLACGRIGCFLNGCCWGKVAESFPLAITFPKDSPAYNDHLGMKLITDASTHSLPVYPTQLMHCFAAVAMAVLVWLFGKSRLKRNHGDEILLLGLLYPIARFIVEFYRGDHKEHYLFGSLTISQSVGIFVFAMILVVFAVRRAKGWGKITPGDAGQATAAKNGK
jgi:phosphatidylglycerol:prolipoprotein diacylglycerol transferase